MLRPIGNNVLIQPRERDTVSAGGIVIPDTAKQRIDSGKVLACGPDVDPSEVSPGLTVWFRHFAGTSMPDGSLMLEDREVLMAEDEA